MATNLYASSDATPLDNVINLDWKYVELFWDKIETDGPNGCWIWTASKNELGYGKFHIASDGKHWKAHRLSYFLTFGPVADGIQLHHICENPACVNPHHLQPATPRQHTIELTPTSPSSINASKTHCQNGHEFNEENTINTKHGRVCRICNKAWRNAKYAKFRDANPLPEKTHCINGHPLSGDNLYLYKSKTGVGRGCRICRSAVSVLSARAKLLNGYVAPPRDPNRTHCKNGHLLTEENYKPRGTGFACWDCKRESVRKARARKSQAK